MVDQELPIPPPASWQKARSFRVISGMSNDQKSALQTVLRDLSDKYLDHTKGWLEQGEKLREKVVEEACARCPYVQQRYEGAWPVEAWLRARLSSSKSQARRNFVQPMSTPRTSRTRTKAGQPSTKNTDGDEGDMKDIEMGEDQLVGDDDVPIRAIPGVPADLEESDHEMDQTLEEICNLDGFEPSVQTQKAPSSSSDATHIEKPAEQPPSSPTVPLQVGPPRPKTRPTPRKPRKSAPAIPKATPARSRREPSAAKPKAPSLPAATAQDPAAPAAPSAVPSTPDQAPSAPTADHPEVAEFLEGLATPLLELLPRFVANGIWSMKSLRALNTVSAERLDLLLRKDLGLNAFQTCIVGEGLARLQ